MYTGRPPEVTVGVLKGVSTPVLKLMPYIDIELSEKFATYTAVPEEFMVVYCGALPVATVGVLKGVSTPVLELMPYIDIVLSPSFATYAKVPAGLIPTLVG